MCLNTFRKQFVCRYFDFHCKDEEKTSFYKSQWADNRIVFMVYRLFMCMYSLGWLIAFGIVSRTYGRAYRFLTIWGEYVNGIYFVLALCLSAVGLARGKISNRMEDNSIKVLRVTTWIFFNVAAILQIIIFVAFWSLVAPFVTFSLSAPFNIHQHAITTIMIFIDLFVAAFPIRLLHAVYAIPVGIAYTLMTVVLYGTVGINKIYGFLDWEESPGLAIGVAIGICVIGVSLAQLLIFGLYQLRLFIYSKCYSDDTELTSNGIRTIPGGDNPAYASDEPHNISPKANDYF